jgi:hypothetical protein
MVHIRTVFIETQFRTKRTQDRVVSSFLVARSYLFVTEELTLDKFFGSFRT